MANTKKELTIADLERMAREYSRDAGDMSVSPAMHKSAVENYKRTCSRIEAKKNAARRIATANTIKTNKSAAAARFKTSLAKPEGKWKSFDPDEYEREAREYERRASSALSAEYRKLCKEKAEKMRRVLKSMKDHGWITSRSGINNCVVNRSFIEYR